MCTIDKHLTRQQLIQYRLRVLADAKEYGVATTARRFGISRYTIYAWRESVEPGKRGPKSRVGWQTDVGTQARVIELKQKTNYGPKRLRAELALTGVVIGEKAIRGVLERADLVHHHTKKRVKKGYQFYAPYPGYRLQVDTKAVPNGADKRRTERYQFTAIDIASRIRFLSIYDSLSNYNSILFVREALAFYEDIGIRIECVQTDNHSTFTNLYAGGTKKGDHELRRIHPLTQYLIDQGIEHKLSRPATPQHNAFVERSHRTDEEEFYRIVDVVRLDNDQLHLAMKRWQDQYNYLRLHSSCNYTPPMQHYLAVLQGVHDVSGPGQWLLSLSYT
jgi:transposase InsO family protein